MRVLIVIVVLISSVYLVSALCGVCMGNGAACADLDKFQYCDAEGIPLQPVYRCRNGTICTSNPIPCTMPAKNNIPMCGSCGKCNEERVFACTNYNTFSLCYGTSDYNDTVEYTCPGNLACNGEANIICTDPEIEGYSCPRSTIVTTTTTTTDLPTTTTTPNPITNPNDFCETEAIRGRHDIVSDPKCSRFIECKQINEVWYGTVYLCPGKSYFNPETQLCSKTVPPRCASPTEICD